MITFQPTAYKAIESVRRAYLETAIVPLDGMWEDAFFANAQHWMIESNGQSIGYFGANDAHALLGFQVFDPRLAPSAFKRCIVENRFKRAFVSTAEPAYLSLCMDHQTSVSVNAFMYETTDLNEDTVVNESDGTYRLVLKDDFEAAINFGLRSIGADRDWLEGYYADRIEKEELFGLWHDSKLIGAGELRISPSQSGVADVGMVVAPERRGKGIAANLLRRLRREGHRRGFRVICSTEADNLAAQKAIEHAGFFSNHRLLDVSLKSAAE